MPCRRPVRVVLRPALLALLLNGLALGARNLHAAGLDFFCAAAVAFLPAPVPLLR